MARSKTFNSARPAARVVQAYSLDPDVVELVKQLAAAENRSVSNMVETLLKKGSDERKRLQLT